MHREPDAHRFELGTDGPSAIVVGVDGTRTSLRAAAFAIGEARRARSVLVVVYVRERARSLVALGAVGSTGDTVAATYLIQDELEAELRTLLADHIPPGEPEYRFVVRSGDPYHELSALAAEVGADSVVVGASSRAGHRIAGSLAVRLVRAGRWPVTVVP